MLQSNPSTSTLIHLLNVRWSDQTFFKRNNAFICDSTLNGAERIPHNISLSLSVRSFSSCSSLFLYERKQQESVYRGHSISQEPTLESRQYFNISIFSLQTFCCEGRIENYFTFEGPHMYMNSKFFQPGRKFFKICGFFFDHNAWLTTFLANKASRAV
ncbi:hypothetical protein HELRODRAFT_162347 [Helobdella robusta]|uniref:Uncharacterized protein n=1 Tax=Helobdella robusta TaxID=6412 RepID=T1ESJ3_HELRO|nr:hypothetical protein HELRODRAFT_162347 [Helobdella robusta]ESN98883.1 hypothetical protein HELRODRAFT_162347 [Helobdella robusta]